MDKTHNAAFLLIEKLIIKVGIAVGIVLFLCCGLLNLLLG